jgi:hypothetical protein
MINTILADIIGWIDLGNSAMLKELSRRVCDSSINNEKTENLIKEISSKLREDFADPAFEKAPFYNIFLACLYFSPTSAESITYSERAENQFSIQGKKWNQVVNLWLSGQILYMRERLERARDKTNVALEHLSIIEKDRSIYGRYYENERCKEIKVKIRDLGNQIDNAFSKGSQRADQEPQKKTAASSNRKTSGLEGYLSLPFIKVFERVQAGVKGPIWSDSSSYDGYTQINQMEINNREYSLYSVIPGDRQIRMVPKKKYAWVFVDGNSMNDVNPTSIEHGDAVLFFEAADAPSNAIVIASNMDQKGAGNQYMVKRWDAVNKLFLSESKEPGHEPVPLDEAHTIMGVVICVAKLSGDV